MQPEQRLEASAKRQGMSQNEGNAGAKKTVIQLNMPKHYVKSDEVIDKNLAEISAKQIDFKHLQFVEWLEFLCRLATCVFVFDAKTA